MKDKAPGKPRGAHISVERETHAGRAGSLGKLAVGLCFLLLLGPTAVGTDTYWQYDPNTPGAWLEPGNWDNGLPQDYRGAIIDNGGTAVISNNVGRVNDVYVGYTNRGQVNHTGGAIETRRRLVLGREPGATGVYNFSGGWIWGNSSSLYVGWGG